MKTIAIKETPTHYQVEIEPDALTQGPMVLQRNGEPVAVLVSMDEYRQQAEASIIRDPALRSGRPIIAGTGTTVRTVAGLYKLGLSAEDIAGELPLTLAQVYAALAYYHLHIEDIEADIQADSEQVLIQQAGLTSNE